MKKLQGVTPLERAVAQWVNARADSSDDFETLLSDLANGGCEGGMVDELNTRSGAAKFFRLHQWDISALVAEALGNSGHGLGHLLGDSWDGDDPLALTDWNRNLLAWFAFEQTARNFAAERSATS